MRLGQLARTLNTTTTEIVNYLAERKITVKDHPNVKLDEATENQVIGAFSRHEELSAAIEDSPTEIESTKIPTGAELSEEVTGSDIRKNDAQENPESEVKDLPQSDIEEVEVIKAPKIQLQGLKVVGKIDLPDPKPKDTNPPKISTKEDNSKKSSRTHKNRRKKSLTEEEREKLRLKNKLAREKRERRENEKRKELERKRLKEQKKEHYLKKIKKPLPAVEKRQNVNVSFASKEASKAKPNTIFGKIWRWLNT